MSYYKAHVFHKKFKRPQLAKMRDIKEVVAETQITTQAVKTLRIALFVRAKLCFEINLSNEELIQD